MNLELLHTKKPEVVDLCDDSGDDDDNKVLPRPLALSGGRRKAQVKYEKTLAYDGHAYAMQDLDLTGLKQVICS